MQSSSSGNSGSKIVVYGKNRKAGKLPPSGRFEKGILFFISLLAASGSFFAYLVGYLPDVMPIIGYIFLFMVALTPSRVIYDNSLYLFAALLAFTVQFYLYDRGVFDSFRYNGYYYDNGIENGLRKNIIIKKRKRLHVIYIKGKTEYAFG